MKIEIENLSFGYDNSNIFENLNFSYHSKDFLAIIGPNGGGKSTLLRLMLGIIEPKSGKISIDSKSPKLAKELIGYVPQHIPVNKTFPMSVLEVVLMGRLRGGLFKFYSKADKNMAMQALEMVGMKEFSSRGIGALSGGQRQRVYIARALVSGARILMLDEPTASIDTQGQAQIYSALKEINQANVGVIAISHDINMAMNFATKVAYVNGGSVVFHDISNLDNREFINHLSKNHTHFCDVELALNSCGCASHKEK
ncbi:MULTISPECIES: metal ABC transporter ATP-binding protein [Campylobacter]|uniref:ABC transporter ATP-binding protein n=1 Tax=Campylobacter vicugnae TaxID=1660076 RepID=A0ABZ2E781_9BACT|nr:MULTISPECIES: ABC transporter ATP-binding protein [unclassified Campylobacter]MCR8690645.1 ABC transporter ATP-binding protein [Campylobacter sp. RM9264]MCR8701446.1 ABC transporter ATP-binding protein [Campylobacter sp. RM12176]